MTLKLLHGECVDVSRAEGATAMGYDRFCKTYQRHVLVSGAASRVGHKAGQTVEVDWSGPTMQLIDLVNGAATRVFLFVAAVPFSRYSFVEPTLDMRQDTWLRAHVAMFDWFGGSVPRVVPDNLKTGVISTPRRVRWSSTTRIERSRRTTSPRYCRAGCANPRTRRVSRTRSATSPPG